MQWGFRDNVHQKGAQQNETLKYIHLVRERCFSTPLEKSDIIAPLFFSFIFESLENTLDFSLSILW